MSVQQPSVAWIEDCEKWRGVLLTGDFAHWCDDWDGLPIDETCPEWPCACAETMMMWRLARHHWTRTTPENPDGPVTLPEEDLDTVWQAWYALGMHLHIRFVCKTCKRQITGCGKKCDAPEHKVEEVESCAVCAQKKGDNHES